MFDYKGRVEKTEDGGCRFYDQDIIFLDYLFTNDCIIDLDIEYVSPGFGILLAEADTADPFKTGYSILYRLGDNGYSVEENYLRKQRHITSGLFFTRDDSFRLHLTFYKNEDKIWMTRTYYENNKEKIYGNIWTTSAQLSEDLSKYRIGFYGNIGNTIHKISIASGMPKDWVVNIKNTNGGRVSFHADGFTIQECEYNADIEQQNIELPAGTYWVSYKESANSDIVVYVNKALKDKTKEGHLTNQPTILDRTKNILKEDGSFTLEEAGKVNLKFTGTHGTIDNIAIKDLRDSSYVSTDSTGKSKREGSVLIFDLNKIESFEMIGTIFAVPEYKLNEKPKYSVFNGNTEEYRTIQDAGVELNKEYTYEYNTYEYNIDGHKFSIDKKSDKLYVFNDISGEVTKLVVKTKSGKTIDVINSDTYKLYISDKIQSPIIVTDNEGEPYDLSAAYREVVIPKQCIEVFNKYQPMNLSERIDNLHTTITVYGIPENATIHIEEQDDIEKFASVSTKISTTQYTLDTQDNSVSVSKDIWNSYKYLTVVYQSTDYFRYIYTNWEREFFDTKDSTILVFEKDIDPSAGKLIIYGIKEGEKIYPDYLYRIASESMIHSIDLFANRYDMITPDAYTINYKKRRIFLRDDILTAYRYFVIDYLKNNSYAINQIHDESEYEVDISSSDQTCHCYYDMGKDGTIRKYITTDIQPVKDKYITVAKKEE